MISLRRQLTVRVLVATLALSAVAAAAVYAHAHRLLLQQFDADTLGQTRVFAALLEIEPSGELEVELNEASLPEYFAERPHSFFELRYRDGSLAARSPTLGEERLIPRDVRPREGRAFDVTLPDGRPGRGVVLRIGPWLERADPT